MNIKNANVRCAEKLLVSPRENACVAYLLVLWGIRLNATERTTTNRARHTAHKAEKQNKTEQLGSTGRREPKLTDHRAPTGIHRQQGRSLSNESHEQNLNSTQHHSSRNARVLCDCGQSLHALPQRGSHARVHRRRAIFVRAAWKSLTVPMFTRDTGKRL